MIPSPSNGISRPYNPRTCKDRLSSLPKHILINILSKLPLESATVTSLLSHQWRYLWTLITSFNVRHYNDNKWLFWYDKKFKQLTSPSIFRFHLSLDGSFTDDSEFPSLLDSWVVDVCARNVEKIKVFMCATNWELPLCVFQTKSLLELDIENLKSFNLPCETNLPNLKKLQIRGCSTSTPSVTLFEKFINSCPSLEDLHLELNVIETDLDSEINFTVKNLKRLNMQLDFLRCHVVIDAPNLEYFIVNGRMNFQFVEIPNALLQAQLRHHEEGGNLVSNFVESISHSVRYLEIYCVPILGPLERVSNLTRLDLEFKALEFENLMKFLEVSPALKVLRLQINLQKSCANDWKWKEWRFATFQTNVNKLELEIQKGEWVFGYKEQHVMNMVNYLLRSTSNDLQEFTFIIREHFWLEEKFLNFKKKLMKCLAKVRKVSNYKIDLSKRYCHWSFVAWF